MNTPTGSAAEQPATATETPAAEPARQKDSWITSIQSLVSTIVIAVFAITFIVQAFQIPSESMETTLLIGDYLLVDKVHFSNGGIWGKVLPYDDLKHGDIVVFRYPLSPETHFVKRVIGLPGDRIKLMDRQVYVNGERVHQEKYARFTMFEHNGFRDDFPLIDRIDNIDPSWLNTLPKLVHNGELMIPQGQYFMMGDNRDHSSDSRYWGLVPRENVVGRPLLIYFSIDAPPASSPDGRLSRWISMLRNLPSLIRWRRMLRIVD